MSGVVFDPRRSIEIHAPAAVLWSWLLTPALLHRWSDGRAAIEPDPDFPALGSWCVLHLRVGGSSTWRARVAAIDSPQRLQLELEGFQTLQGVAARLDVRLEEWIHSTQLAWTVAVPFRGSGRQWAAGLGARLSAPWVRFVARRLLRRLAAAVEPAGSIPWRQG